jgi:uncharacterized OB-fold protein
MIRCGVCGCIQFASATVCPVCQARLEQRTSLHWVALSMSESPEAGPDIALQPSEAPAPHSAASTSSAELGKQRTVAAAPARD